MSPRRHTYDRVLWLLLGAGLSWLEADGIASELGAAVSSQDRA